MHTLGERASPKGDRGFESPPLRMFRTSSKRLSDKSIINICKICHEFGWTFIPNPQEYDYGIDGTISFFTKEPSPSENERWEPYLASCQVKSSTVSKSVALDTEHINTWNKLPHPFYIFLYFEPEDKYYWIDFKLFFQLQQKFDPEKLKQRTISINFTQVLDKTVAISIRNEVKVCCELAAQIINSNKLSSVPVTKILTKTLDDSIAIKDYLEKPIIAMGRNFSNQDLSNRDFRSASLMGADFTKCNLQKSDLRSAALMGAFLEEAILKETDLRGVALMGAFIKKADFRGAKLDEIAIWSIGKAYDYELAIFDQGVMEQIIKSLPIKNFISGNRS